MLYIYIYIYITYIYIYIYICIYDMIYIYISSSDNVMQLIVFDVKNQSRAIYITESRKNQ